MSRLQIEELAILLLEPSLTQRKIIAARLRDAGNSNVEMVSTPEDAWRSMSAVAPDLVISSMYFNVGTGSQLLERMRSTEEFKDVPFMLISSENRFEHLDPVKQAGVMAILPKPFCVDDLKMALEATTEYMMVDDHEELGFDAETLRVLVVDDSSTARKHISKLLKNMGMENITLAHDGSEAVRVLEETMFDIVITDFNMPEMDGERLTTHIRNHSDQSSVPILMVTSENDEARLDSVIRSGVSAICDKPFNASYVKNLLSQLLN